MRNIVLLMLVPLKYIYSNGLLLQVFFFLLSVSLDTWNTSFAILQPEGNNFCRKFEKSTECTMKVFNSDVQTVCFSSKIFGV